jgi:L-alanine-DL-glutamate epimerase-like enolase superfamily enzyme
VPLGHAPEAEAVAFLLSARSSYVTDTNLVVDRSNHGALPAVPGAIRRATSRDLTWVTADRVSRRHEARVIAEYELRRLEVPTGRVIGDQAVRYDSMDMVALKLVTSDGVTAWGYSATPGRGVFHQTAWYLRRIVAYEELTAYFATAWWPRLQAEVGEPASLPAVGRAAAPLSYVDDAVRMALWDLRAKRAGLPLYRLLGGDSSRERVFAYGSLLDFPLTDDEVTKLAAAFVHRGFRALKVKVGAPTVERDLRRLQAVQQAAGPGVALAADANESWNAPTALARLRAFGAAGIQLAYLEDPLPHHDVDGFAALAREAAVPIAAHDYINSIDELARLAERGGLGLLRLNGDDLDYVREGVTLARERGIHAIVGNSVFEYGVHGALAFPEVDRVEFSDLGWNAVPLEPMRFEDGFAVAPSRPGHGLDPDPGELERWSVPAPT